MFLLTTVVQKAASRGLHVPEGAVELGGPTTSRAQMSKVRSLFLLAYLSGFTIPSAYITFCLMENIYEMGAISGEINQEFCFKKEGVKPSLRC